MSHFKTRTSVICYSPKPPKSYRTSLTILDSIELWNLAYLSHDFESAQYHADPSFAVHVRRTAQTRLDGRGLNLIDDPTVKTVKSLLTLPPARFVLLMRHFPYLRNLPLYAAYGQDWLETMDQRAVYCQYEQPFESPTLPDNVVLEAELLTQAALKKAAQLP